MKRVFMIVAFALATAPGCGGSKTEGYDGLIRKMASFKDEMCKCTDAACAKQVYDGLGKWAASQIEAIENAKPTAAQRDAMKTVEDEFKACQDKANGS